MIQTELSPFIPNDESSNVVYRYYSEALRQNPNLLKTEVMHIWEAMDPVARATFEVFHSQLYPGNLNEQQLAARRTLLAPLIEQEVILSNSLDKQLSN